MIEQICSFKTHICYVSAESMPNLLLCLDPALKPQKVYLLASKGMVDNGKYDILAQNFRNFGVQVKQIVLKDISLFSLMKFIEEFVYGLPNEELKELAFNITGGTKLMTVAAINACRDLIEMFYVDTFNNKLFLLNEKKEYVLSSLCSVRNILNSYGFRIINKKQHTFNNGKIVQTLLNQKNYMIKVLNALSEQAKESMTAEVKEMTPLLNELLAKCEEAKLLQRKDNTVIFAGEDSRSFCNGIWLEEHVHHALEQLKINNQISDFEGAVEIIYSDRAVSNSDAKPDNELDALFVRENILYLVECKTCRMDNDEKSRNIMYKLDSLHNKIGGVFARGILISLEPLSENERKHAQKNNLIIIDNIHKIKELRKTLIEIFENETRRKYNK